jgi:hypothetical protein
MQTVNPVRQHWRIGGARRCGSWAKHEIYQTTSKEVGQTVSSLQRRQAATTGQA